MALEVVVDSKEMLPREEINKQKEMLPREEIDKQTPHVLACIWAFIIGWMPMFSKANNEQTRWVLTAYRLAREEGLFGGDVDIATFLGEFHLIIPMERYLIFLKTMLELEVDPFDEHIWDPALYVDELEEKPIGNLWWELFPRGFFLVFRKLGTRVKSILPSTSLGGGQSTSSTAPSRKHARRTLRKHNRQVYPAKKSKNRASSYKRGVVDSVLRALLAAITSPANNNPLVNPTSPGQVGDDAKSGITPSLPLANQTDLEASMSGNQPLPYDHGHPVGDDAGPGITPTLPRSNSALANQTDLEAARNSSTSGNQPPPHDHGHAEGAEQPPPGDHDLLKMVVLIR